MLLALINDKEVNAMIKHRFGVGTLLLFIAISLGLGSCRSQEKSIDVTVMLDFGPVSRPQLEKKVAVPEGSTVFDALRAAFPVVTSGR